MVGLKPLVGLGFISCASPLPLVFSSFRGVEAFAGVFEIDVEGPEGSDRLTLTPALYKQLAGPYNRRNAYGAAIAGAPMLDSDREQLMVRTILNYGFCPGGPLLSEMGLGEHTKVLRLVVSSKTAGEEREWMVPIECEAQ